MAKKKIDSLSFEEAVSRLEETADKLRDSDITLDESIKLYNDSIEYFKVCRKILDETKQKIEMYDPKSGEVKEIED